MPFRHTRQEIKEVLGKIEKEGVKFINLWFSDIFGNVKTVRIPKKKLEGALKNGNWFDASSVSGYTRIYESGGLLRLIPNTLVPDTANKEARFLCDVYIPTKDKKIIPFGGNPRFNLKRQVKKAKKMGYIFNVGPEIEFFIVRKDEHGNLILHDHAGYFDQSRDKASGIRRDIDENLEKNKIDIEADHHEVSGGQNETDLAYGPALEIADTILVSRDVIQKTVEKHGFRATFMPKPMAGINGSGMHIHLSITDLEGNNLFFDPEDFYNLSPIAYHSIGGLMKHIKGLTALTNPTINSYKRLILGYEAPVYICWAQENRSALIRIPKYYPGNESAARIELRNPDSSCNPYIALTGILAAMLDGIKKKIKPPESVEEDMYDLNSSVYKKRSIETLPPSLRVAIDNLQKDRVLMEALGEHLSGEFIKAKLKEWEEFKLEITPLEIEKYL